jgi:hypothetical protein
MTRTQAKNLLPYIAAFAEGKRVDVLSGGNWLPVAENTEFLPGLTYRIAPEPKFRPWTSEEVPMGLCVRAKSLHAWKGIINQAIDDRVCLGVCPAISLADLFKSYEQLTGEPCGRQVL